jgi:hypothetical protein
MRDVRPRRADYQWLIFCVAAINCSTPDASEVYLIALTGKRA